MDSDPPPGTKRCPSCPPGAPPKPLEDFGPDKRYTDGRRPTCRECVARDRQEARRVKKLSRTPDGSSQPILSVVGNTDDGSNGGTRQRKRRTKPQDLDDSWYGTFLGALSQRPNVSEACAAAKVGRETVYERRTKDPLFAAAWDNAREDAADIARGAAWDKAVNGWDEPVFGRVEWLEGEYVIGAMQEIGSKHQYDSSLLKVILQGLAPEFRSATKLTITDDVLEAEVARAKGEVLHLRAVAGGEASPTP